ncbi:septum formation initiator family protein [uncultured Corynebacterium sp.]|uniref:septum formation initiator family protein n=1 Tax=uncultured Corynebacterium sp. TaxID=159447 RepID=UPI0025DF1329|nr:septum formation initiator family protein [uncultured Corynebacterium sp.]
MARPTDSSAKREKTRTTVPVASRVADDRAARGRRGRGGRADAARKAPDRLDIAGYGVLAVVAIFFLLTVSVPLNNYYSGRAEIARLQASIEAKKAEKERLLAEIDKYKSESYIEQQARRRLGVVEPGETAYRILDKQMSASDAVTTNKQEQEDSREWYSVLWDSVANDPAQEGVSVVSPGPSAAPSAAPSESAADAAGEGAAPAEGTTDGEGATGGEGVSDAEPAADDAPGAN